MDTLPRALMPPPTEIHIRRATLDDLPALLHDCWRGRTTESAYWMLSRCARNFEDRRGTNAVVVSGVGELWGYGQMTLWPRCAEISDLTITEARRSQGYGTALVQHLVQQALLFGAPCIEIGAAESNPRALALYRRLGFVDQRTVYMNLGGAHSEPVIYLQLRAQS